MVCLGFEPGPQDGRRRRNHGAMAATQDCAIYWIDIFHTDLLQKLYCLFEKTENERKRGRY